MNLDISHKTHYRYSAPVIQSQHRVHMTPRPLPNQIIRHHSLIVEPAPALRYDGIDPFGNPFSILEIEMAHREFVLHARSTIETHRRLALDLHKSTPWTRIDDVTPVLDLDVVQYRSASNLTKPNHDIADFAEISFTPERPILEAAMDLTRRIYREFTFDPTATDISTPVAQVMRQRRGVCQDFSHVALAALRAVGIPARYVSGYLLTRPPPGQPRLQGADASHAWISVWSPDHDWVDFDPTNGIMVADEHAAIAHGRDFDDVSPISGVLLGGGAHTVAVSVDVRPV
jgi:transglutaminase-like putative cysteine protease